MYRRIVPAAAAAALLVATAVPALAAPPTTTTTHEHKFVETFEDFLPDCGINTAIYTITLTSNIVEKETIDPDGQVHATFTQTGKFTAIAVDQANEDFSGRFTQWGNFNQNKQTAEGSFTFNITGKGEDGTQLAFHANEHTNVLPDGSVHEFFKCHDSTPEV